MADCNGEQDGTRAPRRPWADHWLLEAFQRLGHPAVGQLSGIRADSAWEALQQAGAKEAQLLETACALSARQAADLTSVGPAQAQLLDQALAERYGVLPIRLRDGMLEVATANPLQPDLEQTLEFGSGLRINLTVASPAATGGAIYRVYQVSQTAATASRHLSWVRATTRQLRPDLVITETATPKLDAYGLIQALTQHAESPPVIVCTDQRDQELHGWLRDLGAMDVLGRSHDVASLIRHLEDSARSVGTPRISLTAS